MTQFVETKKQVRKVINGEGPNDTFMSVVPSGGGAIGLVFGAVYEDACAHYLCKDGLKELIDILKDIHDAMPDLT
jgi:hypothetical protein